MLKKIAIAAFVLVLVLVLIILAFLNGRSDIIFREAVADANQSLFALTSIHNGKPDDAIELLEMELKSNIITISALKNSFSLLGKPNADIVLSSFEKYKSKYSLSIKGYEEPLMKAQ